LLFSIEQFERLEILHQSNGANPFSPPTADVCSSNVRQFVCKRANFRPDSATGFPGLFFEKRSDAAQKQLAFLKAAPPISGKKQA
jgi:hypothetical protein